MNADAKAQDVLAKTVQVIAQKYQPEEIVLFGSYAYGTPDAESDIDLLIVKKTEKPFFQRLFEVQRIVSEVCRGYALEPIVLSPGEIEERLQLGDQFIKEILTKGVVMYERQS
ncbi:nucleotidyltransferase domain-containing protein [Candidatus Poribacteria bacterium]|nr:nucleotidyltransferase domain-containing protein [Candidatus Poribacteria bacterium]